FLRAVIASVSMSPHSHTGLLASGPAPARAHRAVYDGAMFHVWPLTLRDRELSLRPLRRRDRAEFERLRERNRDWLRPWDPTDPEPAARQLPFTALRRWN